MSLSLSRPSSRLRTKILFWGSILIVGLYLGSIALECLFYKSNSPKVRMILLEKTWIPRSAFVLSSFPLALASYLRFGERTFVLNNAQYDEVEKAFNNAEFIIVATHGIGGGIYMDHGMVVTPKLLPTNDKLKLIYFGACYIGKRRSEWEKKYPNAKIIAYDLETSPFEGWLYLFGKSWRDISLIPVGGT